MGRFRLRKANGEERTSGAGDCGFRMEYLMRIAHSVGLLFWSNLGALGSQCAGQDLIEYALMAALVATGVVGMSPAVASSFVDILSRVNSVVVVAGSY
jgi:Flp pilus assembly pilin Flp